MRIDVPTVRRRHLLALGGASILAGMLPQGAAEATQRRLPVIVFVHGNGDSAALWQTVIWRLESLGWPRRRLFAIDLVPPTARADDTIPQPGRASTEETRLQLAALVQRVLQKTGETQVALVGNSRGANVIRNYLKNGGGAPFCSAVVLGGGTNHGVLALPIPQLLNNEFNGLGPFMQQLNSGPNEVIEGIPFLTLRSDKLDKFALEDGKYLGFLPPGTPTGISFDAPALKGATNLVLPGVDHRETAFAPQAVLETAAFLSGVRPKSVAIAPERRPVLDGVVSGFTGDVYDNRPIAGARVAVYAVDPNTGRRLGKAVHLVRTGKNGRSGPFRGDSHSWYEFEIQAEGYPVTHIYRSPFPRGSRYIGLRLSFPPADPDAGAVFTMIRERGYLGVGRNIFTLDGVQPPEIPDDPVPTEISATIRPPFKPRRSVEARFDDEVIVGRTWPKGHVAVAEFHF